MCQLHYELNQDTVRGLLPPRDDSQGKWHFGRVLLVCGSAAMSGAALLAGQAALRSGVGLVELASVEAVIAAARVFLPEALLLPVEAEEDRHLEGAARGSIHQSAAGAILEQGKKARCLLFGCGVGVTDHGRQLLRRLLGEYEGTVVLDADGLNLLSENLSLLKHVPGRCVLTPHMGEFCRLSGLTREQAGADPAGAAAAFAQEHQVTVVLKGPQTVITDGLCQYVLDCPNSGLAKGGSGDVLAGLAAGLCAQTPDSLPESAALAVWLHSRAGQLARWEMGAFAMLPRDLLARLGAAIWELEGA